MTERNSSRLARLALASVALAVLSSLWARPAGSDEGATRGREVMGKWEKAVVTATVVLKMRSSYGGETQEEEESNQVTATVVDPSGLAVLSLYTVDPTHAWKSMMEDRPDFKFEAEVTDIRVRWADGKEAPAKVVLRDNDLDVAVIRPVEKLAEAAVAVDLADSATPEILDQVFVLGRLGEVANRAAAVSLDRIEAVVQKPRTMYLAALHSQTTGEPGCPVFSLDGKVIGLIVMRVMPSAAGSAGGRGDWTPVILPAADVLEVVKQAPAG